MYKCYETGVNITYGIRIVKSKYKFLSIAINKGYLIFLQ